MALTNRQLQLARRPSGLPSLQDFVLTSHSLNSTLAAGQVLVKVRYLSIDPAMRVWISGVKTYFNPVNPCDLMPSLGLGEVLQSASDKLQPGDLVRGMLGWQDYAVCQASDLQRLPKDNNPSQHLGVLGINGLSAYIGLVTIAKIKEGETVLVSTAAGAVGSVAVQIAKAKGCRVVGIAGSDEKCAWVCRDLGADACFNYKTVPSIRQAIRTHCPAGLDVYFDNVGGETLSAALQQINQSGRIAMCGSIESYNQEAPKPWTNYSTLILKNVMVQGFIVMNYAQEFSGALTQLRTWLQAGKIKHREELLEGLENCPRGLRMLFTGENKGKVIVRLEPTARL